MSMSFAIRRAFPLGAILALALGAGIYPSPARASGGLISVTTNADLSSCPSGPGQPGFSLRCAIDYENGVGGGDTIIFRITTTATTITLRSALPALTVSNTAIDGYYLNTEGSIQNTNGLAGGNNAVINVTVDGRLVANGPDGIVITGSNDTVRGLRLVGFTIGPGRNGGYAVALEGPAAGGPGPSTGDKVEGNFIGNVDNRAVITPNTYGVGVFTGNVGAIVGGTTAAQANVISGNSADGVQSTLTHGTTVEGNYIGTDTSGKNAVPNATGVEIVGDSPDDAIGTKNAGNLISGNTAWGIAVLPWQVSAIIPESGGFIQGNFIGTNVDQSSRLGNGLGGVELSGNSGLTLGGAASGLGNVIAANGGPGVYLTGGGNKNNLVEGNFIGLTSGGTAMGNQGDGVKADEASTFDAVGVLGSQAASNTIANNGGFGVDLGNSGSDNVHVSVNLNSMYANGGGININGQSPLFCTAGLAYVENTSPNDLTPCPLVLAATPQKVIGEACTGCTVEVYVSPGAGDGEGKTLLGTETAGSCPVNAPCLNFTPWTLPASMYSRALKVGEYISVTSTSTVEPYFPQPSPAPAYAPQTSSFSRNVPVGTTLIVNTTQDLSTPCSSAQYSLRCALNQANADRQGDEIDFNIPSGQCPSNACTIFPLSTALPALSASSTFINGYTQPGAVPNSKKTLGPGDNAAIPIVVNGSMLSGANNGFHFLNWYDSAEGLAVGNFNGDGFEIGGGSSGSAWFDIVAAGFIGTLNGSTAAPNVNGVNIQGRSAFATVGGRAFMDDNVIGGNRNFGVQSSGPGGNTLRANLIGMKASDVASLPNGYDGVLMFGTRLDTIGGIRPDEGNVISASFNNGVEGLDAKGAVIWGNEIGVDGNSDPGVHVGNGFAGVFLYLGANNLVGDLPFGVGGNVIAGNAADGVDVLAETGDLVAGNVVGFVQANGGNGVMIGSSTYVTGLSTRMARHTAGARLPARSIRRLATVGGETPIVSGVFTNVIAGNGKQGVLLGQSARDDDVHVGVNTNSMFQNAAGTGIRFYGAGFCSVAPNGVNDAIFCPTISFASTVFVQGTGCANCLIEVYSASNNLYDQGYGEGKVYLGSAIADGNGNWGLGIAKAGVAEGSFVTATQSQYINNSFQQFGGYYRETSQFAQNVTVRASSTVHRPAAGAAARIKLHSRVNWTKLRNVLLKRVPRAWPHYHVRFRR